MAGALYNVDEEQISLTTLSACAAAIRLFSFLETSKQTSDEDRFPKLIPMILYKAVEGKLQEQKHRPFFSVAKLKRLEDQLGIGMCSEFYHKCNGCGVTRDKATALK